MTINPAFSLGGLCHFQFFFSELLPYMKNPKMQIKQCNKVRHTLAFNNIKKSNKDDAMENTCNVKIIPGNISF